MKHYIKEIISDGNSINMFLIKVMVPTLIFIKLLTVFGTVEIIAAALEPIMQILNLPGETALVWASTLLINIYVGMTVFSNMEVLQTISTAQATTLGLLMLIAHNLIMEMAVAKSAGLRLRIALPLRFFSAIFIAYIFIKFCMAFDLYSGAADIKLAPLPQDSTWGEWFTGTLKTLLIIFTVVYGMVAFVLFLKKIKITNALEYVLSPPLRMIGVSKKAAPLTTIGIILGLAYGGGYLVKEAKKGHLSDRDVFMSVFLLCLTHAVFEDTLLLVIIGTDLWVAVIWRTVASLMLLLVLGQCITRMSDKTFYKYCFKKRTQ